MGYGSVDLTTQDLSYTIFGLTSGVAYTVYVSAINRHGQGARAELETGPVTPPLSVPSVPTSVTVHTKGYNETEGDGIGDSQVNDVFGCTSHTCTNLTMRYRHFRSMYGQSTSAASVLLASVAILALAFIARRPCTSTVEHE